MCAKSISCAWVDQNRVSDPLELELQQVIDISEVVAYPTLS